jgi:glycosyltransferase involved in cell wall biosynthesis
LRLLIVSQYFWPENFRVNELAAGLAERGHDVVVLTGQPNYPSGRFAPGYGWFGRRRETYRGAAVVRVPLVARGGGGAVRLALNYLSFAFFASVLGPFRCRGEFDAIFVHETSPATVGLPALWLKFLKKAPICFWVLDLWPESLSASGMVSSRLVLALAGRLVKFIYDGCDRIVVSSRGFIEHIVGQGVAREKLDFLPQWAESHYRPLPLDRQGADPSIFRILFAGNIGGSQDFATILDAAERLKERRDVEWIVAGGGRMQAWVEREVTARGLQARVRLLGQRPVEEMPALFARADAMLVTLRRDPIFALTAPAKLQAYLACAKPILAALDGEGARIVAGSGAGLAAPAGDAAGLARAALEMLGKSAEERARMGAAGRAYYDKEYDPATLLARLEGWLEEMRGRGPRR